MSAAPTVAALRAYWRIYPCDLLAEMLARNGLPLANREFSFVVASATGKKSFRRFQTCADAAALRRVFAAQNAPFRGDIGAHYNLPVSRHADDTFAAQGRELVFDVDATDYDDVRFCCEGKTVCDECWPLIAFAATVLDRRLREEFAFEHLLWVFSGRRGLHCWVLDEKAFLLCDETRDAVVGYLSRESDLLRRGGSLSLWAQENLEFFIDAFSKHAQRQKLYDDDERLQRLLAALDVPRVIATMWIRGAHSRGEQPQFFRLAALVREVCDRDGIPERPKFAEELVMHVVYPRIDAAVTKKRAHLLKMPFSPHPDTGFWCLPKTVAELQELPFSRLCTRIEDVDEAAVAAVVEKVRAQFPWLCASV